MKASVFHHTRDLRLAEVPTPCGAHRLCVAGRDHRYAARMLQPVNLQERDD